MDMKTLSGVLFIALCFLSLSACKTAEIVFFEHRQSKEFYNSLDYERNDLSNFKDDGVLFVVDIKEINRSDYIVWLGLYSQSPGYYIDIEKAVISGNGWKESISIGQSLKIDTPISNKELVKNSIKLFQVRGDLLEHILNNNGNLSLIVTYIKDGTPKDIKFIIDRRIEKNSVFST